MAIGWLCVLGGGKLPADLHNGLPCEATALSNSAPEYSPATDPAVGLLRFRLNRAGLCFCTDSTADLSFSYARQIAVARSRLSVHELTWIDIKAAARG